MLKNIKKRIFVYTSMTLLFCIGIITFVLYALLSHSMDKNMHELYSKSLDSRVVALSKYISLVELYSSSIQTPDLLNQLHKQEDYNPMIVHYLNNARISLPGIQRITLIKSNGEFYSSYKYNQRNCNKYGTVHHMKWSNYLSYRRWKINPIPSLYTGKITKPIHTITYTNTLNKTIGSGCVTLEIAPEHLNSLLNNIDNDLLKEAHSYFIDANKKIMGVSLKNTPAIIRKALHQLDTPMSYNESFRKIVDNYLCYVYPIPHTNFYCITLIPSSHNHNYLHKASFTIIIVFILFAVIGLIINWTISTAIYHKLNSLYSKMNDHHADY